MKNLLTELQNVNQDDINRQMAEFECTTIPNAVRILGRQLRFWIITVLARFLPAASQKKQQIAWDSMELQIKRAQETYAQQSAEQKQQEISRQLRRKIRMASGKNLRQTVAEDVLSVEVTRAAAGLLPKYQIRGKSVAEINDLISKNDPKLQKRGIMSQLKLWGVYALAWLLLLLCAGKLLTWNGPLLLVEAVLGEVVIAWLVSIRVARLQLAHFIWLVVSAVGSFTIEEQAMPVYQMSANDRKRLALQLQGIHTLYQSEDLVKQERTEIQKEIQTLQREIEQNQEQIHRQEQMTESSSSDIFRILEEKKTKSALLQKQMEQLHARMDENELRIHRVEAAARPLQQKAKEEISKQWKKAFGQIRQTEEFWDQLTRQFQITDLGKMEQRLYELSHTSAPYSIAQPQKGGYQMEFRTAQGDLGRFRFVLQNKIINLQSVERMGRLKEPALPPQQLQKLLTLNTVQEPPAPETEKEKPDNLTMQLMQKLKAAAELQQEMEQENQKRMSHLLEQTRQADLIGRPLKEKETQYAQMKARLDEEEQKAMEESLQLRKELAREKEELMNTRKQYDVLERQAQKDGENAKNIKEEQAQLLQNLGQQLQSYKEKELEYRALIDRYEKEKSRQEDQLKEIRREMDPIKKQYESMKQKNKEELQSIQRKKSEAEELKQQIALLNAKLSNGAFVEK